MRDGFILNRLVTSSSDASWIEDESSKTIGGHRDRFEPKFCFVYSLNQMVPFLDVVEIEVRL
jgi:hypothetical protein